MIHFITNQPRYFSLLNLEHRRERSQPRLRPAGIADRRAPMDLVRIVAEPGEIPGEMIQLKCSTRACGERTYDKFRMSIHTM